MIFHAVWSRNARILESKLMVWPGWQEPTKNAYFGKDSTDFGTQKAVFFASGGSVSRILHYILICVSVRPCVCRTAKCTCPALPRWTQSGSRGVKKPTFGLTPRGRNPTRIRSFRLPNRAKLLFSAVWSCFYHGI